MNDAETVSRYFQIRQRVEALRLVLDIKYSTFRVTVGDREHSFGNLEQLDCFVLGLESRE